MVEYGSTEPWHPMTDPVDVKYLGKFMEECGEGIQASAHCLIQGMNEFNIKEKKTNIKVLEDEIADIEANIELIKRKFNLDRVAIIERKEWKIPFLKRWHEHA